MKIQSRSRNNFAPKETKAFVSKQVKRNAKWVNEDHLCHLCLFWLVLQCLQHSTQQAQNPKSIFNLKHCTITQIFQQPHYSLKNKGRGTCLHKALLYAPRDCRIVLKKLYQDIKEMKIFFLWNKIFSSTLPTFNSVHFQVFSARDHIARQYKIFQRQI